MRTNRNMGGKSYSDCWQIKYTATWHNHIAYNKELRKFGLLYIYQSVPSVSVSVDSQYCNIIGGQWEHVLTSFCQGQFSPQKIYYYVSINFFMFCCMAAVQ